MPIVPPAVKTKNSGTKARTYPMVPGVLLVRRARRFACLSGPSPRSSGTVRDNTAPQATQVVSASELAVAQTVQNINRHRLVDLGPRVWYTRRKRQDGQRGRRTDGQN